MYIRLKCVAVILITLLASCSKKGIENAPKPDEQELITTLKVLLTDVSNNTEQIFTYRVQNGFGSGKLYILTIDTIKLKRNSLYNARIVVLNESVNPLIDITQEIIQKKETHLFFYSTQSDDSLINIVVSERDLDLNGEPFGLNSKWQTKKEGGGFITIELIHGPRRKTATSSAEVAGSTDALAVFPFKLY